MEEIDSFNKQKVWEDLEFIYRKVTRSTDKINLKSHLTGDLKLDSMAILSLTVEIENHFKIILGNELNVPQTIGEVYDFVLKDLKSQGRLQ